MVGRKVQRGKGGVRIECASLARVIPLGRAGWHQLLGVKHDIILWVPVRVGVHARCTPAYGLVELRLQVRPRVEGRATLQGGHGGLAAPALAEAPRGAGLRELLGPQFLANRTLGIGIRVEAEYETRLRLSAGFPGGADGVEHGDRHEPVGVAVERCQQKGGRVWTAGGRPDHGRVEVARREPRAPRVLHALGRRRRHLLDALDVEAAPRGQDEAVLVALRVQLRGHQDVEPGTEARGLAQGVREGRGALLKEDDVGLGVLLLQDLHGERGLVRAEGPAERHLDGLPGVRRDGVQHVHQDGVEDGAAQGLQRHADRLLALRDCRVLCPRNPAQERAGPHPLRVASLGGHLQLVLEHEGLPRRPPGGDVRQRLRVVADDRRPARLLAAGQVDGVRQAVGHGRQPLRPDLLVLQEGADDAPLGEVRKPQLPRLLDAGPALCSHGRGELLKQRVRENGGNLHVLVASGLVDEGLHVLHQPEVGGIVVGHPVFERVVVDGGHVPSDARDAAG
mmetsp:Transcript_63198/g.199649  ORF Transcript_63198/g.199649 Transcript_63198/m.199649 type:complete len:508 (-) Transcript_63198:88-1611(-)